MISGVSPIDTRNATRTTDADAQNRVVMTVDKQTGNAETGSISPTLKTDLAHDMGPVIMRQREGKAGGGKGPLVSDKSLSLTAVSDQILFTAHDMGPVVMGTIPQSFGNGQLGHNKDELVILSSTQGNASVSDGIAPTLDVMHDRPVLFSGAATDVHSGGTAQLQSTMGTLGARSGGSEVGAQTRGVVVAPTLNTTQFAKHTGSNQNVGELSQLLPATVRPRRLMPIECERLMGWPDRWTERGIDEQGRDYAVSDSARYKLCGNGVASPVAAWIGWRLRVTLEGHA